MRMRMNQGNLHEVDWSKIPAPADDGAAAHLVGMTIPPISLLATDDSSVMLSSLPDRTVVFGYPRTRALDLPTMEVAGLTLIKRLALIVDNGRISHVFYPVFPPDRNAGDVLAWLKENPV